MMVRMPTGVPGLDAILRGGIPAASVFILQGIPGAGKTVMANQIAFRQAERGGRAVYVSLLAESHDRLLRNLGSMGFFNGAMVPSSITYISGFDRLVRDGLSGVLTFVAAEVKARDASLLILDGLFVLQESAESALEFRKFINDLSVLAGLIDCTILLLTNSGRPAHSPEYTMVDGWIELGMQSRDYRSTRTLAVHKVRGSDFIAGHHVFTINDAGVTVLPRFETMEGQDIHRHDEPKRLSSGVPDLDRMLCGGLPALSTTLMLGPTGIGKTSFGLHFISKCAPEEPGLILSFYEDSKRLFRRARNFGIDLEGLMTAGVVDIVWYPSTDKQLDQLGYELMEAVRRRKAARLFVNGIDGFGRSVLYPERLPSFLSALTNALRNEGVTTLYSMETPFLLGGEREVSLGSLSAVTENIVLMRYVEREPHLRRTLAIIKLRESDFDTSIQYYAITDHGIRMDGPVSDPPAGAASPRPRSGDRSR